MKKLILCGALLVALAAATDAEPPAGMVLYFQSGDEVYLLLAEHAGSQRGWAAFGGGGRAGETIAETAAHKAHEESRGFFKRADLARRIAGQEPVMDGDFASYFAAVDFVPAPAVGNHPVPEQTDAFLERGAFAWIPYSAVVGYIQQDIDREKKYAIDPAYLPAGSETSWFWRPWLGNMRQALVAGDLPWQKK